MAEGEFICITNRKPSDTTKIQAIVRPSVFFFGTIYCTYHFFVVPLQRISKPTVMKNYIPILLALLFCACEKHDLSGYTHTGMTYEVSFTYTINQRTVTFINKSVGEYKDMDFRWSFGDGSSYSGYNAEHYYAKNGTYTVVLSAYKNGDRKVSYQDYVTINADTTTSRYFEKAYIKGYCFYKLPYTSAYYKVTCTANTTLGGDQVWTIDPKLLTQSDLPYNYIYATHKELSWADYYNAFSWYNYIALKVTYSSSKNGSYTQILNQQITGDDMGDIGETLEEYVFTSNNGQTKVGLLIEYEK